MSQMLTIDGSQGEGGGQILRTSLALSLVTGTPFRAVNIRAGRAKPGLMRQHLTAVIAAAAVGGAEVAGATVGSGELTFVPGKVTPGRYHFPIGTAGSTMLVLQTILPPLLTASAPSTVTLEGGTHTTNAPTFDFIERTFVPLIERMGPRITAKIERHGFYPAGGGRVMFDIAPTAKLLPLTLVDRGQVLERRATALVSQLGRSIAERELAVVRQKLGWDPDCLHIRSPADKSGPGNAVLLEVRSDHGTEIFSAIGEIRRSAESVAEQAVEAVRAYLAHGAPVGPFTADQILIPMALAGGGTFETSVLTEHTTTNFAVIERFLGTRFQCQSRAGECTRVTLC